MSSIFMTEFSSEENDTSFSTHYDFSTLNNLEAELRLADKRRRNRTIDLHDLPSLVWAATVGVNRKEECFFSFFLQEIFKDKC
jgi:hypothetical protein